MEHIKTGLVQIDELMGGLKRGSVYFISASDCDVARGFAASLCASMNSLDSSKAVFYTASPIPYCRCEHIHLADTDELIELLRVTLDGDKTYGLPKTDISIFEGFDSISRASLNQWPCDTLLCSHLYEVSLYAIQKLAEEFQVIVLLMDQLSEDNSPSNDLNCDYPETRFKLSEGTFKLLKCENGILPVEYINHHNSDCLSFTLKYEPKEVLQVYPAYT